jgi:hypothetical protein
METGQDLQIGIYSQYGLNLRHRQDRASIASEIRPFRAGVAVLTFSYLPLSQFFHFCSSRMPGSHPNFPSDFLSRLNLSRSLLRPLDLEVSVSL